MGKGRGTGEVSGDKTARWKEKGGKSLPAGSPKRGGGARDVISSLTPEKKLEPRQRKKEPAARSLRPRKGEGRENRRASSPTQEGKTCSKKKGRRPH